MSCQRNPSLHNLENSSDQVAKLLGHGQQLSESTSNDGLKTQVYEYVTGDRRAEVTYVDGVVVRFAISSK